MAEDKKAKQPTLPLTSVRALTQVRLIAANTSLIRWTAHVRDQMCARDITDADVLKILRTGDIEQEPIQGKNDGEWKVKVTRKLSGGWLASRQCYCLTADSG